MEETKVKARSAATTEVPSGSKELGDQIARLMATLTRAEQGSRTLLSAQTPTMVGLAWAKPLLAALPLLIEQVPNPHIRGIQMHRTVYRMVHKALESPVPCSASGARAGATWPGSVQLLQCS